MPIEPRVRQVAHHAGGASDLPPDAIEHAALDARLRRRDPGCVGGERDDALREVVSEVGRHGVRHGFTPAGARLARISAFGWVGAGALREHAIANIADMMAATAR